MKHAGPAALDRLEPLLGRLRALPGLIERSRGVFYRKGRACLHFHDDPSGLHADLRLSGDDFTRLNMESQAEQDELLSLVENAIDSKV